ncbi:glycosyltransferase [Hoeflea sp. WL0058]|uniref:Glycosyltransferase n=1 Tax=Flavimaribacter sediminis TaxID=2865987 RepID=A0AAE3D3G1_9HYPH|nr:glycosyltransferase [Flavimaribacter sediminis]MBW8639786.1 glycosyltransferase [Flavimaribacter sediminis]
MKIFIASIGTRGDVQPYVALGKGLQAAGHTVTLATCERFRGFVEGHGLRYGYVNDEIMQLIDSDLGRELMEDTNGLLRVVAANFRLMRQVGPMQERLLDDTWKAALKADPDLILFHPKAILGPAMAEKLGIPAVLASPIPFIVPTGDFPCVGFPALPLGRAYNRLTYGLVNFIMRLIAGRYVKKWRKQSGTPAKRRNLDLLHDPEGNIAPALFGYSNHVIPRPSDWPDNVVATGYWFLDTEEEWRPPADLLDFLAAGEPPIYVGFGSMSGRRPERKARMIVEALIKSGHRGILARGWGGLDATDLPDTIMAIDEAPHDWLFPRMAAVVHHGGAGTTAAGLRAGRPTLICPFFADQPFWGRKVNRIGAGPEPIWQKKMTVDRLTVAFDRLVNDQAMRKRAEEIGALIRTEDGIGNAVTFIGNSKR